MTQRDVGAQIANGLVLSLLRMVWVFVACGLSWLGGPRHAFAGDIMLMCYFVLDGCAAVKQYSDSRADERTRMAKVLCAIRVALAVTYPLMTYLDYRR
jgi:hypothetical protein